MSASFGVGVGYYVPAELDLALADRVAALSIEEQERILAEYDQDRLLYDFDFWGRPSQLYALNSPKWLTVLLAGRGYGKTRVLSQWVHKKAMENPGCRIALVGRVTSDVRDVILMGESGVLNVVPPDERPRYVSTMRRVIWPNGSEAMTFSADIANQLRGPQFHYAACDELGSWRTKPDSSGLNAWQNVQIATRLGESPQIIVATTPRRVPSMIEIMKWAETRSDEVTLVRGSTFSNRHLARTYMDVVKGLYGGTHLGRQELEGELVGDIEGALLKAEAIDDNRVLEPPHWSAFPLRAIGVDPSVSENPRDEAGIVAACSTAERDMYKRHAYVLEDATVLGSPAVWAKRAVEMAKKYAAVIVVEDNQGGEMVRMVMRNEDPTVPIVKVKATAGKALRAEPVVLAYEQGRVHHTDYFGQLEAQLTSWVPGETLKSPDRLDALVHGLSALVVKTPSGWGGKLRGYSASALTIPGVVSVGGRRPAVSSLPTSAQRLPGVAARTRRQVFRITNL